jgi:membrane protein YqaA with SNARE-associated domain
MTSAVDNSRRGVRVMGWLRSKIIPLAGLLLVIAIMVCVFYFYRQNPAMFKELKVYGYLGAFIISIILNATIILPVSNMAVMMSLGATLHPYILLGVALPPPVVVGLLGGIGATIGELTGYVAGRSGRGLVTRSHMYGRVEGWVRRWGWLTILIFSIVPFVFDLVGLAAGAVRYPFWKFSFFCWLGRTILYVTMVTLAAMGLKIILPWLG